MGSDRTDCVIDLLQASLKPAGFKFCPKDGMGQSCHAIKMRLHDLLNEATQAPLRHRIVVLPAQEKVGWYVLRYWRIEKGGSRRAHPEKRDGRARRLEEREKAGEHTQRSPCRRCDGGAGLRAWRMEVEERMPKSMPRRAQGQRDGGEDGVGRKTKLRPREVHAGDAMEEQGCEAGEWRGREECRRARQEGPRGRGMEEVEGEVCGGGRMESGMEGISRCAYV